MRTIQVNENCKVYTDTTILEEDTTIGISNITDTIPITHITDDDRCVKLRENVIFMSMIAAHQAQLREEVFLNLNKNNRQINNSL